jgi:hypothetical protein
MSRTRTTAADGAAAGDSTGATGATVDWSRVSLYSKEGAAAARAQLSAADFIPEVVTMLREVYEKKMAEELAAAGTAAGAASRALKKSENKTKPVT